MMFTWNEKIKGILTSYESYTLLDKTWVFLYLDSHDFISSPFDHLTNTSNGLTKF